MQNPCELNDKDGKLEGKNALREEIIGKIELKTR